MGPRWASKYPHGQLPVVRTSSDDQRIGQARLRMVLAQRPEQGDSLLVIADITLKHPKSASLGLDDTSDHLDIGEVRQLMLAILATLWGSLADKASISIVGLPLGPPAGLAPTVSTVRESLYSDSYLTHYISFEAGQLNPGNTPISWTPLPAVQPDHCLFSPVEQERLVNDWIAYLTIDNGYRLSGWLSHSYGLDCGDRTRHPIPLEFVKAKPR